MIIVQNGNDLSVERHSTLQEQIFTFTDKFTLDGKECINKGWQDFEKKSITITTIFAMGNNGNMTVTESYSMDGKNLTVAASASS